MNWDFVFGFTNAIAIVGWLALAVLPRGPTVMSFVLYAGVALLCLTYTALFVLMFGNIVDPNRMAGAPPLNVMNYSVDALQSLFMSKGGVVIGWTHYLAFDLFVGLWIAKDADNKGFSRLVQFPFLFATLMAGPIGLFAWLITREARARRAARMA